MRCVALLIICPRAELELYISSNPLAAIATAHKPKEKESKERKVSYSSVGTSIDSKTKSCSH
jgi:hypothetical protein